MILTPFAPARQPTWRARSAVTLALPQPSHITAQPIPLRTKRRTPAQVEADADAYHESGHAVVGWCYGCAIKTVEVGEQPRCEFELRWPEVCDPRMEDRISLLRRNHIDIDPTGHILGLSCGWRSGERRAQIKLAGGIAESRVVPRSWYWETYHACEDDRDGWEVGASVLFAGVEAGAVKWLRDQRRRTRWLLTIMWPAVVAVAEMLKSLAPESLYGDDVERAIQQSMMPGVQ